MKKVKARKDEVAGESRAGVEKWLRDTKGCTVFNGQARFVDDRTIQIDGAHHTAERFFINVGGRASIPHIAGLDSVPYLTNSTMMDVDFLPDHLIIVGGSYIAIEFAQMYRRFGSRVTILQRGPRLIAREDDDVSQAMLQLLRNDGIDVRLNVETISASKHDGGHSRERYRRLTSVARGRSRAEHR